jgi:hypothetical protein
MNTEKAKLERPFALTAMGWVTTAAGLMLLIGSLYRLSAGRADSVVNLTLVLGCVELIIGGAIALGMRWAYWPIKVLMPINFVVSVVATASVGGAFILWPVLFGASTLVLWGPDRLVGRFQVAIERWHRHAQVLPAVAPEPVEPSAVGERLAA